jgi:hypothetical protein
MRTSSATNVGADKDSERRQRSAIEAYAKRAGMVVLEWFYDPAVSGADPIEIRPGFSALLDRIEGNGVRVVLMMSSSSGVAAFGFFGRGDWIDQPLALSVPAALSRNFDNSELGRHPAGNFTTRPNPAVWRRIEQSQLELRQQLRPEKNCWDCNPTWLSVIRRHERSIEGLPQAEGSQAIANLASRAHRPS